MGFCLFKISNVWLGTAQVTLKYTEKYIVIMNTFELL